MPTPPGRGTRIAIAMNAMRVSLVYNRGAGRRGLTRNQLVHALEDVGHEVVEDGDVVIAAGGDGTVGQVARELVGTGVPMVIVPLGTANNLARCLGEPPSERPIERMLLALHEPRERALDVGVVRVAGTTRFFYESAGCGLFADALRWMFTEADKEPRRAAGALAAFLEWHKASHYEVLLDDIDASGEYTMVEVMNVALLGPNLQLGNKADPTDGKLDIALVTADETAMLHSYLTARAEGRRPPPPTLYTQRARSVRIGLDGKLLRVDGVLHESPDAAYAELHVLPGALRVCVGRGRAAGADVADPGLVR
jgi:diacylglycerol kinase (ATP)